VIKDKLVVKMKTRHI